MKAVNNLRKGGEMPEKTGEVPRKSINSQVPKYVDYLSTDALAAALADAQLQIEAAVINNNATMKEVWIKVAVDLEWALEERQMALEF